MGNLSDKTLWGSEPTPQQRAAAYLACAWNELDKLCGTEPDIWKARLEGMTQDLRNMVPVVESIKAERASQ